MRGSRPINNRDTEGFWGERISRVKTRQCARIGFHNANGVPLVNDMKTDTIRRVFTEYQFDYLGIQEINSHERILPPALQWKRRFPQQHTHHSTNQHCTSSRKILHGGTAHLLHKDMCLRQVEQGQDPTELGRWTWTLLRGRQGVQVRIISGYRPCDDRSNRPFTVFSQHEYYFNTVSTGQQYRNPRLAFFEDLNTSMQQWIAAGDQIILGLDANEDIHNGTTKEFITTWGLIDAMENTHSSLQRVATCNKNSNNTPIDGIWITPSLQIKKAGMTGFGELFPDSDHRLLWMDIDMETLFGFHAPRPDKRPMDSLPIRDPLSMKKYNKYVLQQFRQHKIEEKTYALETKAQNCAFDAQDIMNYNTIMQIQNDIRRRAKRKCRRFYTSQIPYTDQLGILYRRRKLWKLLELKRKQVKVDNRTIRRLMKKVNEPRAFCLTLTEIVDKKHETKKAWKAHKDRQQELREAFELRVDKSRARKFGTTAASQTKQRLNANATRAIFKRIKTVMKPQDREAISTVEVTQPDGTHVECLSRESIEQACIAEGQRRFTQAKDTPFLQGSLLATFGFNANQDAAQEVLQGTFQPEPDVSPITRRLIQAMQMPASIKQQVPIRGSVTTVDHCTGWNKMRAKTGSSPYGPRFCDYIAGSKNMEVASVDASLSSIPYLAGFSPSQWQEASDVMIPKKKTSRNVQKLRIIVLFDAMFNMVNKRIARTMIQQAQDLLLLPTEAYGGVPGRRATTCSLNKILALDIIRMERRQATLCSNDAKSCYDRIVHTVASICMQRLGVAQETCHVMFQTLQELQHHVRTAFGERAQGYSALQIPLHGVGQGNGAGPAIWLAVATPLINILREEGFGIKVTTPITHEENTMTCFVYVDDVDCIHSTAYRHETTEGVTSETQRMLDTWAGALHATGGMIEASKSYWYLIDFKWNKRTQQWMYKTIAESPATLYLRHPGQIQLPLTRKEIWEPDEDGTLGTFISVDGSQKKTVDSLTRKVNIWADKIRTKQLTATEGWLSFRSGVSTSIQYQLTTSRLTRQECKYVTRQLKNAALRASKLPTTYPDALAYAPRSFLGLGLPNIWHIQACLFTEQCLRFGSLPTDPTGLLLRNVIQNMRVDLGVSKCPLEYPYPVWHKCTTLNQFFAFWEYASENQLQLQDGLEALPTARDHDEFIMEVFARAKFSASHMRLLNLCRLYLRVYLVSDIATGDGQLLDRSLTFRKVPFHHHEHIRWPHTVMPNNHCWRLWQDALIQCLTYDHHQLPFKLQQPLGYWRHNRPSAHTFISRDKQIIYIHESEGTYRQFKKQVRRSTRHPSYIRTTVVNTLPQDCIPTTTQGNHHAVQHTGTAQIRPPRTTFTSDWWGVLTEASLPIQELVEGIRCGTAIAVTDGSFKDELGTAAYVFKKNIDDHVALTFVQMTPGMTHDLSAFRAETGGLFGIASFLRKLHELFDLRGGHITVACDCRGALDKAGRNFFPNPKHPNFDLFSELHYLRTITPVTWTTKWIEGHQDEKYENQELDPWAQLNIQMDLLAKMHWQRLESNRPRPFSLPSGSGVWSIWMNNARITSWDNQTADVLYFNASAQQYWKNKYAHFPELDYEAVRMAYKSINLYYQLRVPKWITKRLPVGTKLASWNPDNPTNCPRCGMENETHSHVVTCQHPGATAIINNWLDQLELWLVREHTHPTLRHGVISILRAGFRDTQWTPPYTSDPDIYRTFRRQSSMGTQQVLYGWWAKGWAETQHAYLVQISRKTTGRRWLSRLIKKQWEVSWDLWRHRMEVATTADSFSLAIAHEQANQQIRHLYATLSTSQYPPLQRWLRQSLLSVLQQPLTFKQDWITLVRSFHDPPAPRTRNDRP